MSDERHEWISKRAYSLWEAEGRPHGRDRDHWEQATRERDELEKVALPGHTRKKSHQEADAATTAAVASTRRAQSRNGARKPAVPTEAAIPRPPAGHETLRGSETSS